MIAGLGNPGRKYAGTRHNAGFMAVERLAEIHGAEIKQSKFDSLFGRAIICGADAFLLKPMAFMNRSGRPVSRAAGFFRIPLDHLLVIHDDIDIGYGKIKIKAKGGHGGHNGLRSVIDALGSGDFPRVRIGIGRPGEAAGVTEFVLGNFTSAELREFDPVLEKAAEAVCTILMHGIDQGMNHFN